MKKNAVLQVGAAVSFMLCLVQLFFLQDWHKSINHSKLNSSTCSDFLALLNLDNYQEEVDPRTFQCLR